MFNQLGVIGCGLMGGSFALALKRAGLVKRVVGYSKSPSTTERARKLGVIQADVAVALSLSMTHKSVGFDRRMPEVDFSAPDPDPNAPASTHTLPIGAEGGEREGGRHKQQRVTDVRHRRS